jgi:radical SAM superfamily enzyme YgiQ (UPF0313 family)
MKVTFVYPDFFQYDEEHYLTEGRIYLGIGYLSSYLKKEGHQTRLIHLIRPVTEEEFSALLGSTDPDLVAFSSTTHLFPHVRKWVSWSKKSFPEVLTICGGAHPTIDPDDALFSSELDIICLGEGEEALAELCSTLEEGRDFRRIPSLWIKEKGEVIRNPVRPLIEDLDQLPFPDREIFDPANFCEQQHERGALMASRGCPYNCSYCSNHVQKKVYPNPEKYVRFRSVDNVMREVHQIIEQDREKRLRYIRFDDDILTLNKEWLRELVTRYAREVNLPFICNSRANLMDEEMAILLSEAGCSVVCMGIESGNHEIRRRVLNRPMSEEKILEAFRLCRKYGIKTVSTNMTALPGEGVSELLDTIKLNARAQPNCMQVSTFHPYPHTRLYNLCKEEGLLSDRHADTIFDGRTPLDSLLFKTPEFRKAQASFYPLAELYSRAFELGKWGKPLEYLLDRIFLGKTIPWVWRDAVLQPMLRWAERHSRFEWIYY